MTVITTELQSASYNSADYGYSLIRQMNEAGIQVITREEVDEHFALNVIFQKMEKNYNLMVILFCTDGN